MMNLLILEDYLLTAHLFNEPVLEKLVLRIFLHNGLISANVQSVAEMDSKLKREYVCQTVSIFARVKKLKKNLVIW
jgi:hypothetical protein